MSDAKSSRLPGPLALLAGLLIVGGAAPLAESGVREQPPAGAAEAVDEGRDEDGAIGAAEGLIVVRDAESGEVRQASPEEMRELRKLLRMEAKQAKRELTAVRHDNGMDSVVLNEEFMVFTIAERAADGSLRIVKHGDGPELPEAGTVELQER